MKYLLSVLLGTALLVAACGTPTPVPTMPADHAEAASDATVWILVEGMTKVQGIT
jgi:hypothetical protein